MGAKLSVCDTKKLYDTEFEAERAAAIFGYRHKVAMLWYRCSSHWHIAHKDPKKSFGVGRRYAWCFNHKHIVLRSELRKHKCEGITT